MSTLNSTVVSVLDWTKRLNPDGDIDAIIELLAQDNMMLEEMLLKEGNLPTGEQATIRTGLPTIYWRLMNQGTPPSKATTAQIVENCGNAISWSVVDKDIAELNGNADAYRSSEAVAHIEAMGQEVASTMFYGSAANPEEFVGLANRYTATTDANGENILLGGGSGADNCSVWLIGWGERAIHAVFPKGSMMGLDHKDYGIEVVNTTTGVAGSMMEAYRERFQWKVGLVVKDWRYGVRIPNIDLSDLAGLTGTQATTASTFLPKLMSRAIDRLPNTTSVKPVFYANKSVMSLLRVAALEKSTSAVTIEEGLNQFGDTIQTMRFLGIPVRQADALTITESLVA